MQPERLRRVHGTKHLVGMLGVLACILFALIGSGGRIFVFDFGVALIKRGYGIRVWGMAGEDTTVSGTPLRDSHWLRQ